MGTKISEKLWSQKLIKNTVLSARLRAENFIKIKSKFRQKTLTQACDFFSKKASFDIFCFNIFKISLSLGPEKASNNGVFPFKIFKFALSVEYAKMSNEAFLEKKSHVWVRDFWRIYDLFFMKFSARKRPLKTVFLTGFWDHNFSEILVPI